MTLLPIVERELRVAARRKATVWTRFSAALTALAIGAVLLLANQRQLAAPYVGQHLFLATSVLMFAFSLLAGMFLTADCLCSERREGTLGLLFLTDLRGHDVVLGKLAATSVVAAYALLAIVPVLGLPLLMGGTDVAEFARMVLVLGLTLLLSLATGMLMSALCRDTKSAMLATLGVLTGLTGGLFLLCWGLKLIAPGASPELLVWPNPIAAFVLSLARNFVGSGSANFWSSVACLGGMAIAQLALASWLLPRSWQQGESVSAPGKIAPSGTAPLPRPRPFGITEPFFWLASREKFPGLFARLFFSALVLVWLGFFLAIFFGRRSQADESMVTCMFMAFGMHVIVKVKLAVQAGRRLAEDRRSGALELLLATPLSVEEILGGQWRALRRQFSPMLWTLVLINLLLVIVTAAAGKQKMHMNDEVVGTLVLIFLGGTGLLVSDFHALGWVGMRQGARGARHHRAVMGTLLRVLFAPWLSIFFFVFMMIGARGGSFGVILGFFMIYAVASVFIAQVQALRAKEELVRGFRLLAAGEKMALQPWQPPS
jgi:ABC-type transport system involved in multi-copper enzyme maturation permease subunit